MAKKNMTLEEKLEKAIVKDGAYEVPGNWVWSNLKSIGDLVTGNTPTKNNEEFYGGKIPFIKPTDLNQGRVLISSFEYLSDMGATKARILPKGSTAVCCIGATIGKVAYLNVEGATNQQINSIIPRRINNLYVYYYTLSSYFHDTLIENSSSTTLPIINKTRMGELLIPLPPLKEQQRIVYRIESLFEKLDKAKELIEEAREGFEKRKSAVLEKAFRGELTEKWRLLNGLGKGKMKKIKDISELISGQHISSSDYNTNVDGTPYLTGPADFGEISPIITKWTEKPKIIAMKNDILITVKGSGVGKVNILDRDNVCISRQLMAIRSSSVSFQYIFWYLKSQFAELQALSTGTAIPGLSRGDILNLEIYCADIGEESEIVRILDKLLEEESKIEELTQLEEQIELIKKSILAKAFRGELGTNLEEDESALELLKKILG